ncbi:DUF6596 domain-containing protein [Curtobacterium sp. MCBD17_003]|uniref:RNA polymerase sigma factor n=1 Tax=Curtobacterium sp. MCBD17_003 TaxID=2175667 RepID=UPI000DAA3278|nr:DUF6596 domain-containing protein [Curtobacterium sp. MCBD17_003]WIE54805.1 sigma factor [Curtobacterium sp. MCBD17_003]
MTGTTPAVVRAALEEAHRRGWAGLLAAAARVTRDLDLAEECVQEASATAIEAWSTGGVPDDPVAWLATVARRRALDAVRRAMTLRRKLPLLVEPDPSPSPSEPRDTPDHRLDLVFLCCHPALAPESQLALTLRLVCGIPTADAARLLLVPEATMAARLTRAKRKIHDARIPFRTPPAAELPHRLPMVLATVHLVFTAGHTAPSGAGLLQPDLLDRAIELGRMLVAVLPDDPEVQGLLALMLATDARRSTRVDAAGALVALADQDRSRWDRAMIEEARDRALRALRPRPGRFALQAAIAVLHAEAPFTAATDWRQIRALYDALARAWPSPMVLLARAVATAEVDGPAAALVELERLRDDPQLARNHHLAATRAELLHRSGRPEEAVAACDRALALVENAAERDHLLTRRAVYAGVETSRR